MNDDERHDAGSETAHTVGEQRAMKTTLVPTQPAIDGVENAAPSHIDREFHTQEHDVTLSGGVDTDEQVPVLLSEDSLARAGNEAVAGDALDRERSSMLPAAYVGLSQKTRITIIFCSLLLAALSISFTFYQSAGTQRNLLYGAQDVETLERITALYQQLPEARLANKDMVPSNIWFMRAINIQVQMKRISNQQSLALMCLGCGVALFAIGYALFLIGADGAFRMQAAQNSHSLVLYGTAPGLLCFALGACLIAFGTSRHPTLTLNEYVPGVFEPLPSPTAAPQPTPAPQPVPTPGPAPRSGELDDT